jgi:8-oxo-dGTP pyrophosphatase MutT (NUDIX family)
MKFLFLFFNILFIHIAAHEYIHEQAGIFYKTDKFGDIYPKWDNIPKEELPQKLSNFVSVFENTDSAIILEIPHAHSPILKAAIEAKFAFHYGNQSKTEWVIKNSSSIPEPYTAISGAHVVVYKDDKVLVMEEITRKGILGLPAGGAEPGEFVRETASRELFEEVGLIAKPEDLKLIALINRQKANRYHASLYGHCFIAETVEGTVKIDPREVVQAFWVSLSDLANSSEINGLKISPYINAIAKHIQNQCESSFAMILPDIRQTSIAFDPKDTMNVEFFHQKLNKSQKTD